MNTILKMDGISKSFPGVKALDHLSFELQEGECHAIVGENGAGKSTLMKILNGIYTRDEGSIYVDGREVEINSKNDAMKLGIAIIHQELLLAENVTVAENIFLGREPLTGGVFVDAAAMNRQAAEILRRIGSDMDPRQRISELSTAQKQVVEIAKALSEEARILVMDEPTSSLSSKEIEKLFALIKGLKKEGKSIVYISHRFEELFEIADRATVIRDGQYICTMEIDREHREEFKKAMIAKMVGRELVQFYAHEPHTEEEVVLELRDISTKETVRHISMEIHKGEILGMYGLVGAGRTEIARAIYGIDRIVSGKLFMSGKEITVHSPEDALNQGIALASEDRKGEGLVLIQPIDFNIELPVLGRLIRGIIRDRKGSARLIEESFQKLLIKAPSAAQITGNLSGGNQQKVVLAKCLAATPRVLILDEPTKGIDVGAKAEIYRIMDQLAGQGVSILIISSDLPEVINVCDRVVVICNGAVSGTVSGEDICQETIAAYATGAF